MAKIISSLKTQTLSFSGNNSQGTVTLTASNLTTIVGVKSYSSSITQSTSGFGTVSFSFSGSKITVRNLMYNGGTYSFSLTVIGY